MLAEFLNGAWSEKDKGCQGSFWLADSYAREPRSEQAPITAMEALTQNTMKQD